MLSTCGKCGGHRFELSEQSPSGSNFKLQFVQCTACGVPVGAMEYFSAGAKLTNLENEMVSVKTQLNDVQYALRDIQGMLQRLR